MSRTNNGESDRIYYNVIIANNENKDGTTEASVKNVLNQQIINNPSKYYLAVLRFQIPTADIPILIPEIEKWPNTDINKTVYKVTLSYQIGIVNYISTKDVIYESVTPNAYVRPITAINKNPMINPSNYYFIYNYRDFINMVNKAYIEAYNDLNTQVGNILTSGPPFITYNGSTYLMTLHAGNEYLGSLSNPIKIFMNYKLFTFFDGIEVVLFDFLADEGLQIIINDYNGTNYNGTYYLMSQQYPSLSLWNVFKSLQIVSNLLPIENEIIPIPSLDNQNTYNTSAVLKDFLPFYENGPEFRTFINFTASGTYELINLNSNAPIKTIDITVYWIDRYGNKYILTIPYNQVLSIKLAFIKKSTFTG